MLPRVVALLGTFIMGVALLQPGTIEDWRVLALASVPRHRTGLHDPRPHHAAPLLWPGSRSARPGHGWPVPPGPTSRLPLGEFVAFLGALLPVLSLLTAVIFIAFCLLQAWRAAFEERVLAAAFPEYADYRRRTPAVLPWPRP